jgi:hypothetical protein
MTKSTRICENIENTMCEFVYGWVGAFMCASVHVRACVSACIRARGDHSGAGEDSVNL